MKSDQLDETNSDTLTTPLSDTSNYPHMEPSPPVICLTQVRIRE
jgi:hypothetical protein